MGILSLDSGFWDAFGFVCARTGQTEVVSMQQDLRK